MFPDGLAQVYLDEQEGEMKRNACRDDAEGDITIRAVWNEAEIGCEESKLESQDASDVAVRVVLA